jgi:tetratricopeptide (TPR) repeat protein
VRLAEAIHGANAAAMYQMLDDEVYRCYEYDSEHRSNVHLDAEISLLKKLIAAAPSRDELGARQGNLGNALGKLGERESGTARLEEAITAFRATLKEYTRERDPFLWAHTQNNLGYVLSKLGRRNGEPAQLEEAVASYHSALQELVRERVPLDWAMIQNNLGIALFMLWEWDSGKVYLEGAKDAYRTAIVAMENDIPLDVALAQKKFSIFRLFTRWENKNGTARLEEAIKAFRAALQERPRERIPFDWAMTHNNLGAALLDLGEAKIELGEAQSGTICLEESVAAYRAALEEWTEESEPHWYKIAGQKLDEASSMLAERRD